jgi:hypothetical protein
VAGGLRLALERTSPNDRRVRFARLSVSPVDDEHEIALVTDAQGRLRYRLPPGEYRLHLDEAPEQRFEVGDGWTTVRIRLLSA